MKSYSKYITELKDDEVFVFTSNSEEDIKNNRIVCGIFPPQKNIVVKFTVTPKE